MIRHNERDAGSIISEQASSSAALLQRSIHVGLLPGLLLMQGGDGSSAAVSQPQTAGKEVDWRDGLAAGLPFRRCVRALQG